MSLKIMVVDDEPLTLKVMRSLIVPLGHTVLTLDRVEEASQQLEKQRFDVIFVGTSRPDELDFPRRIRDSQANRETPVAVLSAEGDLEILRTAFRVGATWLLPKPVTAAQVIPMLTLMATPGWKAKARAARLPLFTEVKCKWGDREFATRSMNISESGMLLQSSHDLVEGQEVSLEFKIAEARASLGVRARVIRKEGTDKIGIEFIDLAPEDQNTIRLYVMGHLKEPTRPRDLTDIRMRRLFDA